MGVIVGAAAVVAYALVNQPEVRRRLLPPDAPAS